jgi:hypothetical protein
LYYSSMTHNKTCIIHLQFANDKVKLLFLKSYQEGYESNRRQERLPNFAYCSFVLAVGGLYSKRNGAFVNKRTGNYTF